MLRPCTGLELEEMGFMLIKCKVNFKKSFLSEKWPKELDCLEVKILKGAGSGAKAKSSIFTIFLFGWCKSNCSFALLNFVI